MNDLLKAIQKRILYDTTYLGIKICKNPFDLFKYQEIIFNTSPGVILEIGTGAGGSTLWLANLCGIIGKGIVISIDVDQKRVTEQVRKHGRIILIEGDATKVRNQVLTYVFPEENIMVIEDSSHEYDNTLSLLKLYSSLLKIGDYFIVEDTICHHGLSEGPSPGPFEAVEMFLRDNPNFESDRKIEPEISWNPTGYLKRVG